MRKYLLFFIIFAQLLASVNIFYQVAMVAIHWVHSRVRLVGTFLPGYMHITLQHNEWYPDKFQVYFIMSCDLSM